MQRHFLLSGRNFYADKQHSNKVLPSDARGAPLIMPHRVV